MNKIDDCTHLLRGIYVIDINLILHVFFNDVVINRVDNESSIFNIFIIFEMGESRVYEHFREKMKINDSFINKSSIYIRYVTKLWLEILVKWGIIL